MKKVIVMGATSGIGLKVAYALAQRGHRVGVAGRKVEVLKKLKEEFPEQVEWEEIDITRQDALKRFDRLIERLDGMDTYFHVSGVGFENPQLDAEHNAKTLQTNVLGFARMIDHAYTYFRDINQPGHIAAVTSVAGMRGIGPMAAYSASKCFGQAYLEALEQLAHIQQLHIRFTDVRPGWIRTPLLNPSQNYPMTMSLDYAMPRIMRALNLPWRVNYIDWRWGIVARLMKLIPGCLWTRLPLQLWSNASAVQTQINKEAELVAAHLPAK